MDSFFSKKMESVSSQEVETFLAGFTTSQDSFLRDNGLGYESQELVSEILKCEEIEAENAQLDCTLQQAQDLSPTGFNPSTDPFPGYFNFTSFPDNSALDKVFFSKALQTIFLDVEKTFQMKFSVNQYTSGMYIRALPLYSSCEFSEIPVDRCPSHKMKDDPDHRAHGSGYCDCLNHKLVGHVLRSKAVSAMYEYNESSKRHSVVIPLPLPQPGCNYITIPYHFVCKTSCASGMNRRSVYVIFTLENEHFQILGRQRVSVKVCACPKRDMDRMEKDLRDSGEENVNNETSRKDTKPEKRSLKHNTKDVPVAKKIMLNTIPLSSDSDGSDYERENLQKDLEKAMQMAKNLVSAYELFQSLAPTFQQIPILFEKIQRMQKKINKSKNRNT